MKSIAVITEFNPLHNGHRYFLQETRKQSGADYIVAVMSGDYVQRGEPAIFDKYVRTKAALSCGADLVLELPVQYAAANAGKFANGAVSIINALGVADELWFGSECGEIEPFSLAADILIEESDGFKDILQTELKKGKTYPAARAEAIVGSLNDPPFKKEDLLCLLSSPNNILGLEYCIALKKLGSTITPKTLKRVGSGHDEPFGMTDNPFISASAVRNIILANGLKEARSHVPDAAFDLYNAYCENSTAVDADDFSLILKYKIMSCSAEELSGFEDVSEDLARRIKNSENQFRSYTQFADLIKTRNITRSHANRALLHILLNIRKPASDNPIQQVRVLGFGNCPKLFSAIKQNGNMELCSRNADDLFASNLYETVRALKSGSPFVHEYEHRL